MRVLRKKIRFFPLLANSGSRKLVKLKLAEGVFPLHMD